MTEITNTNLGDSHLKEDMYSYLDDLRESGAINMFGAPQFLQVEFGIDKRAAKKIVGEWMKDFK